jgi:hypothetical protein
MLEWNDLGVMRDFVKNGVDCGLEIEWTASAHCRESA